MAGQCYTARASCAPLPLHLVLPILSFHPSMGTRPRSKVAARVSLIVPALIWPGTGITATLKQLDLSALAAILGLSRPSFSAPQPWSQWLPQQFGADSLDWAKLRWAGEIPIRPSQQNLLCADPVSLNFASDALLLRGPHEIALQPEECRALISSLNSEFSDLGEWFAASPERWYLIPRAKIDAQFHPLSEVLGRPVAFFPPEGPQAREWNRIANEVQVMLHNHPVNQARSERGQLMANALWFWGQTVSVDAGSPLKQPCSNLFSPDPILRGLGLQAGCAVPDSAEQVCAGLPGHCWWMATGLQDALLAGDLNTWLGEISRLEHELFQPLLAAWKNGRIKELNLISPSDKTLLKTSLNTQARWAFWRKPLNQTTLAANLQTSTSAKSQNK